MSEMNEQELTSIEDLEPKMKLQGTVTHTELYGAFVDVGVDRDGLIHISRLSNNRVRKVTDVINVGDKVDVWVMNVDPDQGRIALTMVEPPDVEWHELEVGQVYEGNVVRMERYGAFVDIGAERPGLLHVREMGSYVRRPEEVVRMGETVQVAVRNIDRRKRQIDFTLHSESADYADLEEEIEPGLSPMEIAFLQAQAQAQEDQRRFRRKKGRGGRDDDLEDIYRRTLDNS
jgi:transcriptional accessory protein Tex/SPT6